MLNLALSYIFDGIIWKIIANQQNEILAIEVRNTELRSTSFSVLNIEKNTFLFQNITINEPWWLGMEAISEQYLFLHLYDSMLYAQHKGIVCISIAENKEIWKLPNHTFSRLSNTYIYAQHKEGLQKIDVKTANILEKDAIFVDNPIQNHENEVLRIYEDDVYFAKLYTFILQFSGMKPCSLIEYLDFRNYILISFYIRLESNKLKNYFYVLDKNDTTELLKLILADNVEGVGSNTFCVLKNKLVLCKDKNNIIIYDL